jgi:AcrR family transcriptional regulator
VTVSSAPTAGPGRPPDPGLVDRVHKAACRVYGQYGWRGFTIEAVSREAAVGKASIYARWDSKEELLTESLAAQVAFSSDIDTGELRSDMIILAKDVYRFYEGEYGAAALRLLAEARLNPQLGKRFEKFRLDAVRAARKVVQRAIVRGELPADTNVTALLLAIFGGVIMHVVSPPPTQLKRRQGPSDREVEGLVDLVLHGARATWTTRTVSRSRSAPRAAGGCSP